jgi:uncharacterized protein YdaU (DUF1376 family)
MYRKVLAITASILIVLGSFAVVAKQREVLDWWALRNYSPPEPISALANDVAMTEKARDYFYVNHPMLVDEITAFREACPIGEQSIVLGCFHSGQRGIYIYDVQSDELHGVEQVTAAHEMLHASYERLSSDERQQIDAQLNNFYQNELKDKRVKETIENYRKNNTPNLVDEMHSIFGTEVAELPAELEEHYRRFFSDRSKVVDFSEGYEGEFTNRIRQIEKMDRELESLKQQTDSKEASLTGQSAQIEADRQQLNILRQSDVSAYNAAVPAFNAKIISYNSAVRELEANIARYNRLVEERNDIAAELADLNEAIDTRLQVQAAE